MQTGHRCCRCSRPGSGDTPPAGGRTAQTAAFRNSRTAARRAARRSDGRTAAPPAPTPPRQTEKIHTEPRGLSPHPAASAKASSMQRATCWDNSPRTAPCRRKSSMPCGRTFRASANAARSRVFHANKTGRNKGFGLFANAKCASTTETITGQYPPGEYQKPIYMSVRCIARTF